MTLQGLRPAAGSWQGLFTAASPSDTGAKPEIARVGITLKGVIPSQNLKTQTEKDLLYLLNIILATYIKYECTF